MTHPRLVLHIAWWTLFNMPLVALANSNESRSGEDVVSYHVKGHQCYYGENPLDADPATFRRLDENYAKDNKQVYFEGQIIKGADPTLFSTLAGYEGWYATDGKGIFIRGALSHVNPQSFSILRQNYSKNATYVYYENGGDESGNIQNAEPKTFAPLDAPGDTEIIWSKDNNHVYFGLHVVPQADPKTFVVCNARYGKDTSHVFHMNDIVPMADPISFQVFQNQVWFGKDKDHVFTGTKVIQAADPSIFEIVEVNSKSGKYFNARDKRHKYFYDEIIE